MSKIHFDKEEVFQKKYPLSYPRIKKKCLNCKREYLTIAKLKRPCPFCKVSFDFDPKKIMEGFTK